MAFISMDEVYKKEGLYIGSRGRKLNYNLAISKHNAGKKENVEAKIAFYINKDLAAKANLAAGDKVNFVMERKTKECFLEKVIDGQGGRTLSEAKKNGRKYTVVYPYYRGYHLPLPGTVISIPDNLVHPKRNSIVFSLEGVSGISYD
jgi:hypothetical protein